MRKSYGWIRGFAIILLLFLVSGCGLSGTSAPGAKGDNAYLTVKDDTGRQVVLPHQPQRIVILAPSFLELLYAVDGKAVGRPSTNAKGTPVPQEAQSLPEVGLVYNISLEKVVSLQPDLVVAMEGMHDKLVPLLESSQIPVLVLKYKTHKDIFDKIRLFGAIAGTAPKAEALVADMEGKLKQMADRVPKRQEKVAILHATAKTVTLETESSIAGSTARLLGLVNVAAPSSLGTVGETVPYSLEKLVEHDPSMIFVVTMGNGPEIEKTFRDEVENNPAWSSLKAVKGKKVMFLPSELFLVNPGLRITAAADYMAKLAYPELYAHE